jgi:SAM-dependent methyltransferase
MEAALDERLPLTGERTAPGWEHETYWLRRHQAAYAWVTDHHCSFDFTVVDVGSGEGYGAAALARTAGHVIAIELDGASCLHSARNYPQVQTVCANVVGLPCATNSADLVVSLQVIEHVWDPQLYLHEMRRVSRGAVVVSTPNRPVFSPGLARGEKPTNPFHVEEFDAEQLHDLFLAVGFRDITVLGLHHGERIRMWERDHGALMPALVEAALTDHWTTDLQEFEASVCIDDFSITPDCQQAQDVLVIAQ